MQEAIFITILICIVYGIFAVGTATLYKHTKCGVPKIAFALGWWLFLALAAFGITDDS